MAKNDRGDTLTRRALSFLEPDPDDLEGRQLVSLRRALAEPDPTDRMLDRIEFQAREYLATLGGYGVTLSKSVAKTRQAFAAWKRELPEARRAWEKRYAGKPKAERFPLHDDVLEAEASLTVLELTDRARTAQGPARAVFLALATELLQRIDRHVGARDGQWIALVKKSRGGLQTKALRDADQDQKRKALLLARVESRKQKLTKQKDVAEAIRGRLRIPGTDRTPEVRTVQDWLKGWKPPRPS